MNKVGLITYHSAYNFGSVLQAYATQEIIKKISGNCTVINYRMKEQRKFYSRLRTKFGIKVFIKDLMLLSKWKERGIRKQRFESFITECFNLTSEFLNPENAEKHWKDLDIMVSGSDQIWNKHSCELEHNGWRYMEPYLLKGFEGRKISYASSTANMDDSDFQYIKNELIKFDSISMREAASVDKISELIGGHVETVLDPTLLLSSNEWYKKLNLEKKNNKKYVLFYSLDGIKDVKKKLEATKIFAEKRNCEVISITPFVLSHGNVESVYDAGPLEFLNLLIGAEHVITDSYHGTILSVNFHKDVYSICKEGGSEFRKTDVLEKFGMTDRLVYELDKLMSGVCEDIDYDAVDRKIEVLRGKSLKYLERTLK